uniref:Uncharacterized protein n=1 Tax=Arundo donax TaxID=35708 RepID=A0A0A8ZAQ6_ARUDO
MESILSSLLAQLASIKMNHNSQRDTWSITDLIIFILDEEEEPQ